MASLSPVSASQFYSSSGGSSRLLDVGAIVDSLIRARETPLLKVKNQIDRGSVLISAFGELQGKISRLKDAVTSIENTSNYKRVTSSDEKIISIAGFSSSAEIKEYLLTVSDLGYDEDGLVADVSLNGELTQNVTITENTAIVDGLTLNINGEGSVVLRVANSTGLSLGNAFSEFIDAYNDLMLYYKTELTYKSNEEEVEFSLSSNSSIRAFFDQLRNLYSSGSNFVSQPNQVSFATFGISINSRGYLSFDKDLFDSAMNDGLADDFFTGVTLGGLEDGISFSDLLDDATALTGSISSAAFLAEDRQVDFENRKLDLELRMDQLRDRYTEQYARLDAQLLSLQGLSNSLTNLFTNLSYGIDTRR